MAYEKTVWIAGTPENSGTPISGRNLANMDSQYDAVIAHWGTNSLRELINEDLVAEVLASAPVHANGRLYHNSGDNRLYGSAGGEWHSLDAEDMTGIS